MSSDVEQIKSKLSVAEIVGQYIELQSAGRNYKARCPFHNEKSPSFMVSPERQTFYCFGCGKKGDIFTFVQEFEGVDFPKALEMLADKAGVKLTKTGGKNPKQKDKEVQGLQLLEQAKDFYQENLSKNEVAKTYLKNRGLSKEVVETWGIGFAQDDWRSLKKFVLAKHSAEKTSQAESLLLDTGLIKQGEKGESYDTFRNRIQFPLYSEGGRVVGFTGRSLDDGEQAKYLNSPDTFLFNKSNVLYGFHLAKGAIRKNGFSILVEGQFDVIASHMMGYKNTVATSGTAISETQLTLLKRLSNNLVIALDGDSAGFRASERVWKIALGIGLDVKVAALPEGTDPADMLTKDVEQWKKIVKSAKHVIEFVTDHYAAKNLDKRSLAKTIHSEVVPLIQMLESAVEQSYFAEYVSKVCQLDLSAIQKEIQTVRQKTTTHEYGNADAEIYDEVQTTQSAQKTPHDFLQHISSILLWQKNAQEPLISNIDHFIETFKKLLGDTLSEKYLQAPPEDSEHVYFELESQYTDPGVLTKTIEEILQRLERKILEKQRVTLQQKIVQMEASKDHEQLQGYLEQLQVINQKIQNHPQ